MATIIGIFLSVLSVFFLIRLIYRRSGLHKLAVEISFSKPRATQGEKLTLTTVLTNEKWLPLPWVAVKFRVSRHLLFADTDNSNITDQYYRNDLYNILMRQRITRRLNFECSKRGFYRIDSVDLAAWDMLMEAKNAEIVPADAHLTVYPTMLTVPEVDNICVQIYGHMRAKSVIHPDPFSFRGIREYSPNDPLRAVNFKASAKGQGLMVNLWEYMNSREVIMLYNLERHSIWHNEVLDEHTIKVVASLADRLTQENVPIRFITNGAMEKVELSGGTVAEDKKNLFERLAEKEKAPSHARRLLGDTVAVAESTPITEIHEGIGELHLTRILEALALLDVSKTNVAPFHEILTRAFQEYKTVPEYWIISTYHGPELTEVYRQIKEQGARVVWILPYSVGLRTGEDDISLPPDVREQVILV